MIYQPKPNPSFGIVKRHYGYDVYFMARWVITFGHLYIALPHYTVLSFGYAGGLWAFMHNGRQHILHFPKFEA